MDIWILLYNNYKKIGAIKLNLINKKEFIKKKLLFYKTFPKSFKKQTTPFKKEKSEAPFPIPPQATNSSQPSIAKRKTYTYYTNLSNIQPILDSLSPIPVQNECF